MIAIRKGAAPAGLVRDGEEHARALCALYQTNPGLYQNSDPTLPVRRSIYASDGVKVALHASHHGKCCYCETAIPVPYAYPHVEHWRPQSSWRQDRHEARTWPGYYWLAYTWENLLLSCSFCNSNKNDVFPLEDPATRARHHGMPIANENPAILKPDSNQNPRDHIKFHMEVPVGLTPLGRKTIDVLSLDSPAHEQRLAHLSTIRKYRDLVIYLMGADGPNAREWEERFRQEIEEATRPNKPYSAMVVDYLHENPLPPRPA